MARAHTEADIREVCQKLYDTGGESAVTRVAVEKALMTRAVERGLEPTAGDHRTVSAVIAAMKAERRAARENAQAAASGDLGDFPLPAGLDPVLEQVRHIYRRAMREEAQRSESTTQIRVKHVEAQAAEAVAALRAETEALERDAATLAGQLDAAEAALVAAQSSLASISATQAARVEALEAQDRETRAQLSVVQQTVQETMAAGIDAEQRAQVSELSRAKALLDLALAAERNERLEVDLAEARSRAATEEARAREADSDRGVAQGQLTALKDHCAWLRDRVPPVSDPRQSNVGDMVTTGLPKRKRKSVGGPEGVL
jgi:hypothetical protein